MDSKIIIVTGANTGIGYATTKLLVEAGYQVVMACRSTERGQAAVDRIISSCPNPSYVPVVYELDLAEFSSIHNFVSKFKQNYSSLSVLLNNAGLSLGENRRCVTKDGHEMVTGTNHLGHFLLTHLLLDVIKATAASQGEARIVVVTSQMHKAHEKGWGGIRPTDFSDLELEKPGAYNDSQAYKESKAMNLHFTLYLARQLQGSGVTVNCVCPGFVPDSDFLRNFECCLKCLIKCFVPCLRCCGISRTLDTASNNVRNLCTAPELKGVTGCWYLDGEQNEPSAECRDEANQEAVWRWSLEKCGL